jgi:hypothetical protein
MTDIERLGSKEQKFDIVTDAVEGEYSPEYLEYLKLQETFTGKALTRLHVSCSLLALSHLAATLHSNQEQAK